MKVDVDIYWIDRERDPQHPANPKYPFGVDIDVSNGKSPNCYSTLPYPALRIGAYHIECRHCGANALVTTAGRADDPRSVRIACKGR